MKLLGKAFRDMFKNPTIETQRTRIHREWTRQQQMARTPNERSEIDAIFSRHL